jgi:hypothetical protein
MAFDIILAEHLKWKQENDSGVWFEIDSKHYDFIIDVNNVLYIYWLNSDDLHATRQCVDVSHAQFIAKAFEITAERNTRRGTDWRGYPWPPKNRSAE